MGRGRAEKEAVILLGVKCIADGGLCQRSYNEAGGTAVGGRQFYTGGAE